MLRSRSTRDVSVCIPISAELSNGCFACSSSVRTLPSQKYESRYAEFNTVGALRVPIWLLTRSEEHTSELQSQSNLVCRLLLEKKKKKTELICITPLLTP